MSVQNMQAKVVSLKNGQGMQARIDSLKAALFENPREISLERALLYTESYKASEGENIIIRRAKASAHVLDHIDIAIRDNERIAANCTTRARAGMVSPEMDPKWLLDEIDTIATRPQDPFVFTEKDKAIYRDELYPYWKGKDMRTFIQSRISDEVKAAESTRIFSVNQTDKGQGHIIVDYPLLLNNGLDSLISRTAALKDKHPDNDFYRAAHIVFLAVQRHIQRYIDLAETMSLSCKDAKRKAELQKIVAVSKTIKHSPPQSLHEAIQLFWYVNIALQYESNASSISLGRFDQYMLPFYLRDIQAGVSNEDIKELLAELWVKTNDIVLLRSEKSARSFAGFPTGYTILLGGLTSEGRNAVNPLSYLALEAYQSVLMPQPNLGVRFNELIPRSFALKTAETIRMGTGIPQIFNDEVVVPSFLNRGVRLEDARDYSVVGCVELSIPGRTYGLHDIAMFNLLKVMEVVLHEHKDDKNVTFDVLIEDIHKRITSSIQLMIEGCNACDLGHRAFAPVPFLSSLVDDCLEKGEDITEGGARYNFSGAQGIGIANLSDSLVALKHFVFEEKKMSFHDFVEVLERNWKGEGDEAVRHHLMTSYAGYGNDSDEADDFGSSLLALYCKELTRYENPRGGTFIPGSYTVSAHVPLGAVCGATPDGRHAGEQLADGGLSPMLGRDIQGPTAVLKSVSKLDSVRLTNGSLLNVKFTPKTLEGDTGLQKLVDFLMSFMKLKIQHVQFNVLNAEILKEAQREPEKYASLVVRVAGYSAFFVDLSKEIQNDIIQRTSHRL